MEQTVQTKSLKAHPKLVLDVIKRQAGTLHKAILEGAMNAIEANSSSVYINFRTDEDGKGFLSIKDNGKGISSITEIENFFETFGTPHDESEGKIWAQFRMGRGQLFSFGKNVWRTSEFKMTVDVENWGLEYQLERNHEEYKGCSIEIELYDNPVGTWRYRSVESLKEQIKEQIEFMDTPVYFNGEQINTNPENLTWDFEDEYAYYSFGFGTDLTIYNLGAYVMKIPSSKAGVTGFVVSKQQVKVNFARNDIQQDCKIYEKIQKVITANRVKKARKNYKSLTPYERQALITDIRDKTQLYKDVKAANIFETSQGKYVSLNYLLKNRKPWVFAPVGDRLADKSMQMGLCVCLSKNILKELNYLGKDKDFFNWLLDTDNRFWINDDNKYEYNGANKEEWDKVSKLNKNYTYLTEGVNESFVYFEQKQLTKVERRIIRVLEGYRCWDGRTITIGASGTALAWTDGSSYIALDRDFLRNNKHGSVSLFHTLLHELAHDGDTKNSHFHGPEYYENFYEISGKYGNPFRFLSFFQNDMKKALATERYEADIAKEKKAEADKKKKLGM